MTVPKINGGSLDALGVRLKPIVESQTFQTFIIGVILINAVTLGLETSKSIMASFGPLLQAIDLLCLAIFIVEIVAKLVVYRLGFFKNAWNVFDLAIVSVALLPAGEGLSVVRALRILRALRLISMVPQMRMVVQALLSSIPAMGSVMALLSLIYYVAAVMATKLFGADFPEWFGTIGASLYTLFQIMTLESWSMGIVRPVMEKHPHAWVFFVPFILVMTFMVLNLFIAIVVNSMTEVDRVDQAAKDAKSDAVNAATATVSTDAASATLAVILAEIRTLRSEIDTLKRG
ncbi:MAG: ion transporter [Hyphomicrobium aestuarii]|nr:ion transporter [Hyphomicrobium aestuarii]